MPALLLSVRSWCMVDCLPNGRWIRLVRRVYGRLPTLHMTACRQWVYGRSPALPCGLYLGVWSLACPSFISRCAGCTVDCLPYASQSVVDGCMVDCLPCYVARDLKEHVQLLLLFGPICFVRVWLVVLVVSCFQAWHRSVVVASFLG